jgi:hypothetical protein
VKLKQIRVPTVPALAVAVLMAAGTSSPADGQDLLERARGPLGGDAALPLAISGSTTELQTSHGTGLTDDEIRAGLRETLGVATEAVVRRLGSMDGFSTDPVAHIPLPKSLEKIQSTLGRAGFGARFEHLEMRLNMAAEVAVAQTQELFAEAIAEMTMDDVIGIYRGPDDAATQYFRRKMSAPLVTGMRPIVDESLQSVGAPEALERVIDQYHALPLSREVDSDLTGYVVDKAMDGIFHYLAQEEAAIRRKPVSQSSELLRRLFSN